MLTAGKAVVPQALHLSSLVSPSAVLQRIPWAKV